MGTLFVNVQKPNKILYIDALSDSYARANVQGIRTAYTKIAGSGVNCFDYRLITAQSGIEEMNRRLARCAIEFEPDFIHLGKGETIRGETIHVIKKHTGARVAHFYGDYRPTPPAWVMDLGQAVDVTMIQGKDEQLRHTYHNYCHRVEFLNCGTDPGIFYPHNVEKDCDVIFMAQYSKPDEFEWMSGRVELIKAIALAGFSVRLFGAGWMMLGSADNITIHPFVTGSDFAREVSKAKISISYGTNQVVGYTSWPRLLNSMAAGCFVLTRYFPGLNDTFENCHDLVWFGTIDHAVKLVNYYTRHNDERERIARNGREIVLNEHTWDNRVRKILSYLYD